MSHILLFLDVLQIKILQNQIGSIYKYFFTYICNRRIIVRYRN